jgi:hypothetical protein
MTRQPGATDDSSGTCLGIADVVGGCISESIHCIIFVAVNSVDHVYCGFIAEPHPGNDKQVRLPAENQLKE